MTSASGSRGRWIHADKKCWESRTPSRKFFLGARLGPRISFPLANPLAQRPKAAAGCSDDWQMPFASSRGYGSLTLQHDVAEMLGDRHAKTGQSAKVYFVSDLDPSGLDLQRSWEEALTNFDVHVDEFTRIGLTRDQVRVNVDMRARPLEELGIGVKVSDSRSARYIERYGPRSQPSAHACLKMMAPSPS
jgi:hypothetical protein